MSTALDSRLTGAKRELVLIKRLFSMLDDVTLGEILATMDVLTAELEREAAQAAMRRIRRNAIGYWRQTVRGNTRCWVRVENLAFLERHEHLAPKWRTRVAA